MKPLILAIGLLVLFGVSGGTYFHQRDTESPAEDDVTTLSISLADSRNEGTRLESQTLERLSHTVVKVKVTGIPITKETKYTNCSVSEPVITTLGRLQSNFGDASTVDISIPVTAYSSVGHTELHIGCRLYVSVSSHTECPLGYGCATEDFTMSLSQCVAFEEYEHTIDHFSFTIPFSVIPSESDRGKYSTVLYSMMTLNLLLLFCMSCSEFDADAPPRPLQHITVETLIFSVFILPLATLMIVGMFELPISDQFATFVMVTSVCACLCACVTITFVSITGGDYVTGIIVLLWTFGLAVFNCMVESQYVGTIYKQEYRVISKGQLLVAAGIVSRVGRVIRRTRPGQADRTSDMALFIAGVNYVSSALVYSYIYLPIYWCHHHEGKFPLCKYHSLSGWRNI